MTGYGESFYNTSWYLSSPYIGGTELTSYIKVRIVKPIGSIPPVMDTIYYGLAQRFDLLQQGIQAFALFNKITYARGSDETENSILPSLDDVWGKIYNLPRLTGETDDDYRSRLQTYVRVLTGCGTISNCQNVIDFLIGCPGAATITSRWPAKAHISFSDVNAMRLARSKMSLLNSVLPGMFAAGVEYDMPLPYLDSYIKATIRGDATREIAIRAAIQTENEAVSSIYALIAFELQLRSYLISAIRAERQLDGKIDAVIRAERGMVCYSFATVCGQPELPVGIKSAIQTTRLSESAVRAAICGEPEISCKCLAAIARVFDLQSKIIARVCYVHELSSTIKVAVRTRRQLSVGIRARVARRYE